MHFIGKVLNAAGKTAKRYGGEMAAVWVRENGHGKGEHVHILLHLPRGLLLTNKTRRWIVAAGGTYRRDVSRVQAIGGSLASAETGGSHYELNAGNLLAYLLKHADDRATKLLKLPRRGESGRVVGKRCGTTQNIAKSAQERAGFAFRLNV